MKKRLIDNILAGDYKAVAVIGLAKNVGKTVTFNTLVQEAWQEGLSLALVSFGRDGEALDAVTNKRKPRIYVPPQTIYITARQAARNSLFPYEIIVSTGINTVLGELVICKSREEGGEIELIGVNTVQRLNQIKQKISSKVDLFLIDGALDRRSSATPLLADGVILATGAVLSNTLTGVLRNTLWEYQKLMTPKIQESTYIKLIENLMLDNSNGLLTLSGEHYQLKCQASFQIISQLEKIPQEKIDALIISGSLTDDFLINYISSRGHDNIKASKIIIKDSTKNFLTIKGYEYLNKNDIDLYVYAYVNLIALTANPYNPEGRSLDSQVFLEALREKIRDVPVYDVKGLEY